MKQLFMPGCSLSSYNPSLVLKTAQYLTRCFPDIITAQRCCAKPTKLMGQKDLFDKRLKIFEEDIKGYGVKRIISACPGCIKTLSDINDIQIISLWEIFCETGLPNKLTGKAAGSDIAFSVHDSCAAREDVKTHESVRRILNELGYSTVNSDNEGVNTLCCGQGGMVGASNKKFSDLAVSEAIKGFKSEYIAVYCSSCRSAFMSAGGKAWHMLDLIWGEVVTRQSAPPKNVLASPLTAWKNRFVAKTSINKLRS